MSFLGNLNWTAIILTILICFTSLSALDRIRSIARIWLEGMRAQLNMLRIIQEERNRDRERRSRNGAA